MFLGPISLNGNFLKNGSLNSNEILSGSSPNWYHSWQPTILQDAELMQNVMQENLHLAEYLILK